MQLLNVKNLFRVEIGTTEKFQVKENGKEFDFPEAIEVTDIVGKVVAMKLEDSVVASGEFEAKAVLICDRCLDNFDATVSFELEREYILDRKSESEEGLYVDKYGNIDLTTPIREELILSIPTQNFCRENCPGICPGCGQNLKRENCTCKIEDEITK